MKKVNVVKAFGDGDAKGKMDPRIGMVTDAGLVMDTGYLPLVSISGNGVGSMTDWYAYYLNITEAVASGTWAWPTGVGSVQYGHKATTADQLRTHGDFQDQNGQVFNFDR